MYDLKPLMKVKDWTSRHRVHGRYTSMLFCYAAAAKMAGPWKREKRGLCIKIPIRKTLRSQTREYSPYSTRYKYFLLHFPLTVCPPFSWLHMVLLVFLHCCYTEVKVDCIILHTPQHQPLRPRQPLFYSSKNKTEAAAWPQYKAWRRDGVGMVKKRFGKKK